jgi:hypothetical protein
VISFLITFQPSGDTSEIFDWVIEIRDGQIFNWPSKGQKLNARWNDGKLYLSDRSYYELPLDGVVTETEKKFLPSFLSFPLFDLQQIATTLLTRMVLKKGEELYRIGDIEFYLATSSLHDHYCKTDIEYTQYGCVLFPWVGGEMRKVEITFGDGISHGSILIRAIARTRDWKVFASPTSVAKELYNGIAAHSIFHSEHLSLQEIESSEEIIYNSPRVILHPDRHPESALLPYRYLILPKIRYGRNELIYGLRDLPEKEIQMITSARIDTIRKYRKNPHQK